MNDLYRGSCLCGEIRFEIEGTFEQFYLCHCEHCRKDTGSAHAANLFSRNATLKWISSESKVIRYNLPSTRHSKCFCSICGSALPRVEVNGQLLIVPAGSLDTDIPVRPNSHIFCASRANWDDALENIPKVDKYPS